MEETLLVSLAGIIVLGISGQWIAWRINLPSILVLLGFGLLAGPIFHVLDPDHLFGELLLPGVSLAVSIILFEGGLTLDIAEIYDMRDVIFRLISIGVLVSMFLTTILARFLLGMGWQLALLLGAVLVVTGPTVIIPMLREIRPTGRVGPILRWEGILIDPVGAVLALLVFEHVISAGSLQEGAVGVALVIGKTLLIGIVLGLVSARFVVEMFSRFLVPDHLQSPFTLMVLVAVFAVSNTLQAEAGLLTATVMGIALANQDRVVLRHVFEFKETLGILLLSGLFIVLAARLETTAFSYYDIGSAVFFALLILVVRPAVILFSTWQADLELREQVFLSVMAPRGIVAAAISSIFALELKETGYVGAELLVPYTLGVIIITVLFYGLAAGPVARRLRLAVQDPQGVLIVGAHNWAREIGKAIHASGFNVIFADTNHQNVAVALYEGLPATSTNVLAENFFERVDLANIGCLVALTSNNEVNALAALNFSEIFGRAAVYRLSVHRSDIGQESSFGRTLFHKNADFEFIENQYYNGARVMLREVKTGQEWQANDFLPMFVIDEDEHKLHIWAEDSPPAPRPGQKVLGMTCPSKLLVDTLTTSDEAETTDAPASALPTP